VRCPPSSLCLSAVSESLYDTTAVSARLQTFVKCQIPADYESNLLSLCDSQLFKSECSIYAGIALESRESHSNLCLIIFQLFSSQSCLQGGSREHDPAAQRTMHLYGFDQGEWCTPCILLRRWRCYKKAPSFSDQTSTQRKPRRGRCSIDAVIFVHTSCQSAILHS